jgi:hypothetical protein
MLMANCFDFPLLADTPAWLKALVRLLTVSDPALRLSAAEALALVTIGCDGLPEPPLQRAAFRASGGLDCATFVCCCTLELQRGRYILSLQMWQVPGISPRIYSDHARQTPTRPQHDRGRVPRARSSCIG